MKILMLTEFFAPSWSFGGPPKVLFEIARELVKRKHSVTVFATNVLDAHSEIEKACDTLQGINVYYLNTLSKWLAFNEKVFLPIGLNKLLKDNIDDFDIVLISSVRTFFNLLGYRYAKKFHKPYLLLPYGSLPRGSGLKKIVKFLLDPLFGYGMLRDASFVFAQTEHEMLEALKYGAKNAFVKLVPLNIDLSEFENPPRRGTFRTKHHIRDNERVILFLGRLHKYKGIDLLVKSFSQLIRIRSNYKLVIVGRDDGYLSSMLRLIKLLGLEEKAIFVGPLYGEDRIKAYVDADVFVMPSFHFEETSTAALEACASSVPVIVTKQASIPGLSHYQAGFTINYDQKELENALMRLLDDENLRQTMGRNARKMVEEIYSSAKWVDRFEQILNHDSSFKSRLKF